MFSAAKYYFGQITVTQTDKNIVVDGINSKDLIDQIIAYWETKKITNHIFSYIKRNSLAFPKFFALEFLFVINQLIALPTKNTNMRALTAIRNKLLENTYLADVEYIDTHRLDFNKLNDIALTPLESQMRVFKNYDTALDKYGLNGHLLNSVPGSGKTYMSLTLAHLRGADKIFVFAPLNSIVQAWEENITNTKKVFKETPTFWHTKMGRQYNNERIIIAHYEEIPQVKALLRMMTYKRAFVIVDEVHNFSTLESKRTTELQDFAEAVRCNDWLLMSGTLLKAMVKELVPFFRIIDPVMFTEDVENRFKKIFSSNEGGALEILNHRMGVVSTIITAKDIGLDEPIVENVAVKTVDGDKFTLDSISKQMKAYADERMKYYAELYPEFFDYMYAVIRKHKNTITNRDDLKQFELYERSLSAIINASKRNNIGAVIKEIKYCNLFEKKILMKGMTTEERIKFDEVRTVVKYVKLKIRGECLGKILGRARIEAAISVANTIDYAHYINLTVKKTLIFSSYTEVVDVAVNRVTGMGYKPSVVYGKTNKDLDTILAKFRSDPNNNPIAATFQSLSTAVPLTEADLLLLLDSPFRTYILDQTISRARRLGADTIVRVFIFTLDTGSAVNVSSRSLDILKWSQEQIEAILNIKTPFEITEGLTIDDSGEMVVSYITQGIDDVTGYFELKSLVPIMSKLFKKWAA